MKRFVKLTLTEQHFLKGGFYYNNQKCANYHQILFWDRADQVPVINIVSISVQWIKLLGTFYTKIISKPRATKKNQKQF